MIYSVDVLLLNSPKAEQEAERRARRLQSAAAMSVRLMSGVPGGIGSRRESSSLAAATTALSSAAATSDATGDVRRSSSTAKIVNDA